MPFAAMGITNARLNAAELQIRQNGEWAVRRDAETQSLVFSITINSVSLRLCVLKFVSIGEFILRARDTSPYRQRSERRCRSVRGVLS